MLLGAKYSEGALRRCLAASIALHEGNTDCRVYKAVKSAEDEGAERERGLSLALARGLVDRSLAR